MKPLHSASGTGIGYNPGISYRGGEFLAAGINQAGNALAEGLQRYATNKEESAALDTRFESTAKPLMEKLQLYGQLADETGPAAALLDKSADWHKLGTSQKKVLLADMLLLGDKTEAEQRRKEEENRWRALHQLQQDQLTETQKHHADQIGVSRQGMALEAVRTLGSLFNQSSDNARGDAYLALAQQNQVAADKQRQKAEADRAAYQAIIQLSQPLEPGAVGPMPSLSFNAARAMQQTGGVVDPETLAALGKFAAPRSVPGSIVKVPGLESHVFGVQSDSGAGSFLPIGQPKTDKPMTTRDRIAVESEIAKTIDLYNKAPDAASRGRYLDVLKQLEAQRGPGPAVGVPAPAPAAGGDGKVIVEKDGKKFRLPKTQLEQAQREGYKLVP